MSQSNWLRNPPLFVGALLAAIYGGTALYTHQEESAYHYSGAYQQTTDPDYGRFLIETPPPEREPERDEWREEQDLQAQRDMSLASLWMAIFSGIGVGVTAIGVWFVRNTLVATRATLDEAKAATAAANDGAKAAWQTAEESKRIGEAQVRAYLSLTKIAFSIDDKNSAIRLAFNFHNSGQSPARNIVLGAEVLVGNLAIPPTPLKQVNRFIKCALRPIGAQQTGIADYIYSVLRLDPEEWGAKFEKIQSCVVIGALFYRDVFQCTIPIPFTATVAFQPPDDRGIERFMTISDLDVTSQIEGFAEKWIQRINTTSGGELYVPTNPPRRADDEDEQ